MKTAVKPGGRARQDGVWSRFPGHTRGMLAVAAHEKPGRTGHTKTAQEPGRSRASKYLRGSADLRQVGRCLQTPPRNRTSRNHFSSRPSSEGQDLRCMAHRGATRPPRTRLEAWSVARGAAAEADLVRGSCAKRLVRAVAIVPGAPDREFMLQGPTAERDHDEPPRAFGFQRPNQALDHGDAAVLADGPESLPDPAASAPASEDPGNELLALVGDHVIWRDAGFADDATEEIAVRP